MEQAAHNSPLTLKRKCMRYGIRPLPVSQSHVHAPTIFMTPMTGARATPYRTVPVPARSPENDSPEEPQPRRPVKQAQGDVSHVIGLFNRLITGYETPGMDHGRIPLF